MNVKVIHSNLNFGEDGKKTLYVPTDTDKKATDLYLKQL